jgi:hypothetical protein
LSLYESTIRHTV